MKAQTPIVKVQEFGIGFNSLSSFSLQYRWGNDDRLFKLSGNINGTNSKGTSNSGSSYQDTVYNSTSSSNATNNSPLDLNLGLSLSVLKIKSVVDKFGIVYGGVLGLTYTYSESNSNATSINNNTIYIANNPFPSHNNSSNNSYSIQPYIGICFGFVYKFNPSIYLYADVSPNIYYSYSKSSTISSNSQNVSLNSNNNNYIHKTFGLTNFSNSGAMLTLVYHITK